MPADLPPSTPPIPPARGAVVQPAIPALTTEAAPDSPKAPSPAWRGMLAKVPESASLAALARNPPIVRVFYRIPRPQWPKGQGFVLVVIDRMAKQERRFPIGEKDASPAAPEPIVEQRPIDPRVAERLVIEGYLNIHFFATVIPPPAPGTYALRVEVGPHRSTDMPFRVTP